MRNVDLCMPKRTWQKPRGFLPWVLFSLFVKMVPRGRGRGALQGAPPVTMSSSSPYFLYNQSPANPLMDLRITEIIDVTTFWGQVGTGRLFLLSRARCVNINMFINMFLAIFVCGLSFSLLPHRAVCFVGTYCMCEVNDFRHAYLSCPSFSHCCWPTLMLDEVVLSLSLVIAVVAPENSTRTLARPCICICICNTPFSVAELWLLKCLPITFYQEGYTLRQIPVVPGPLCWPPQYGCRLSANCWISSLQHGCDIAKAWWVSSMQHGQRMVKMCTELCIYSCSSINDLLLRRYYCMHAFSSELNRNFRCCLMWLQIFG